MAAGNLRFAIALPPGWQSIDLLSGEGEQMIDAPLAEALAAAARGSEHGRVLMLRSLVALTSAREPLAAGLAVTLAGALAPISQIPLSTQSFEDRDASAVTVPAGGGIRIRRIAPDPPLAGVGPLDVLRVQYMLHTKVGLLTITFTTPQAARTREWEALFDVMADTAQLA